MNSSVINSIVSKYPVLYQAAKVQFAMMVHVQTICIYLGVILFVLGVVAVTSVKKLFARKCELTGVFVLVFGILAIIAGLVMTIGYIIVTHQEMSNPTWYIYQLMLPQSN